MQAGQSILPLFPLQIMLFPEEEAPLHIFEPRYKQLMKDCREKQISFGIPYVNNAQLLQIGTEVRLDSVVREYDNGALDVLVKAFDLFELLTFQEHYPGRLYSGGTVKALPVENLPVGESLKGLFQAYLSTIEGTKPNKKELSSLKSLDIASRLDLTSFKKYQYLSLRSEREKQHFLAMEIKLMLKIREQENSIQDRFHLN